MNRIVITGFMGCGKTKVAREIARRFNTVMVDLDNEISSRVGRSPAQLIVEDGEAAFREVESETLGHVLKKTEVRVIALGGGAWIQETNRQLLDQYNCVSVWLDAPFEMCWARILASQEDRPLGRTKDHAFALYQQRRPIYQLADVHIPISVEDFEGLVSRILHSLDSLKHE